MGVSSNKSSKQVSGEIALYTGLHNFVVQGLNPTKEQLEKAGRNPKSEPVYTDDTDEGAKRTRLDFYLFSKEPKISTKVAFWVEDRHRINQAGDKVQVTNNLGQFTWLPLNEEEDFETDGLPKWFSMDGLREAYTGEETLVNQFIRNWANVETNKECYLEDVSAIAQGNIKELKNYVAALKGNEVKCLLGINVNNGNAYQSVYPKFFDRPYNKRFTRWIKQLEDPYGMWKDIDYQNSFEFQTWTGKSTTSQDTPDNMDEEGGYTDDPVEDPAF